MSRVRFWTILLGDNATSFRAPSEDALIPTLKQLQRAHPQAVLRWFEAGRLWSSPEEARRALRGADRPPRTRGEDWRPGGEHRDPRARYEVPRDVKRRRFAQRLRGHNERPPQDGPRASGPGKPTGTRSTSMRKDVTRGTGRKKSGRDR